MRVGLLWLVLAWSAPAFAGEVDQKADVKVGVKGMVCSFCAQGIEKKFGSDPAVKGVNVDLDQKKVYIRFKEGQSLDRSKIEEVITGAGYNVEKIDFRKKK